MKLFSLLALLHTATSNTFFYSSSDLNIKAFLSPAGAPRIIFGQTDDNEASCVTFVGAYETSDSLGTNCGEDVLIPNSEITFKDFTLFQHDEQRFTFGGKIQGENALLQIDFDVQRDTQSKSNDIFGLHYDLSLHGYEFVGFGSKLALRIDANSCKLSNGLNRNSIFASEDVLYSFSSTDDNELDANSADASFGTTEGMSIDSQSMDVSDNGNSASATESATVSINNNDDSINNGDDIDEDNGASVGFIGIDDASDNLFNFGDSIIVNYGMAMQSCASGTVDLEVSICYAQKSGELRYIFDNFKGCDIDKASSFIGANLHDDYDDDLNDDSAFRALSRFLMVFAFLCMLFTF